MTRILIVAEHAGGKLNTVALAKCVTCARKIEGAQIDAAVRISRIPVHALNRHGAPQAEFSSVAHEQLGHDEILDDEAG